MKDHLHLHVGQKPAPGELSYLQGFVNTIDLESGRDDLATSESATAWLHHYDLLSTEDELDSADHGLLLDFREALRERLFANNGDGAATDSTGSKRQTEPEEEQTEPLAAFTRMAPLQLEPRNGGRLQLVPTGKGIQRTVGRFLAIAYHSMLDGSWPRLKACRNDGCRWAFYDASKNRSGSWCSMEVCGNRTKVRQHRERRGARHMQ